MSEFTTSDGTQIFSGDDWDAQMLFFLLHGSRVIAHDRRGHGRSGTRVDLPAVTPHPQRAKDLDLQAHGLRVRHAHHRLPNATARNSRPEVCSLEYDSSGNARSMKCQSHSLKS